MTLTTGWTTHDGKLDQPAHSPGWAGAISAYRAWLSDLGRRGSTIRTHSLYLRRLAEVHPDPWAVTAQQLEGWLRSQGQRNALLAVRGFYAWARRRGHVDQSPAPAARPHREAKVSVGLEFPLAWAPRIDDYLHYMRSIGTSAGTARLRLHWLGVLAADRPDDDPISFTTRDLTDWMGDNQHWQPDTRKSVRSTLRTFYAWCVIDGLISDSPAARLPTVRVPRCSPRPTAEQALARALTGADDEMRLMLLLGGYAGLRAAEIAAVRFPDVIDGQLFVTGKGGHRRVVPLHPLVAEAIAVEQQRRRDGRHGSGFRYMAEAMPDGPLFPGLAGPTITPNVVGKKLSRALGDGFTAHSLRHRFATRIHDRSHDLRSVQELLGHASLETTQRYVQVSSEALRAAVASL